MTVTIMIGDSRERLKELPANSVHCCVSSPPYFGLRDYGCEGQMGLEATPDEFVAGMVGLFREVRRVLRDDGTLWLIIGDSYVNRSPLGIPWLLAFALRSDGWKLRQEIIWSKPNPAPERATDRCTRAHESLFLFSKKVRYYFDASAIAEPSSANESRPQHRRARQLAAEAGLTEEHIAALRACGIGDAGKAQVTQDGHGKNRPETQRLADEAKAALGGYTREFLVGETRSRRSVWTIPTMPYSGAHCAVYPPDLISPCIQAGAPIGGVVLDPFLGSGTTAIVARGLRRDCIGIELNPEYAALAERRIKGDAGLFAEVRAA